MQKTNYDFIVPGLDVLIGDPEILDPPPGSKKYAKTLYIPEGYVHRVIDFYHEQSGRGDACRELTCRFKTILNAINESKSGLFTLKNGTVVDFVDISSALNNLDSTLSPNSSKDQAIITAKQRLSCGKNVAIMTGSDQLATLAALHGIHVIQINPDVYTGRRKVKLSLDQAYLWYNHTRLTQADWHDAFPDQPPLRPNEFIEFISDDPSRSDYGFRHVGRFSATEDALLPLKNFHFPHQNFSKIYPQNPGQAMLIDALLAPPEEIPLVIISGIFGTGKTFLATAAGYYGVTESSTYERVFVCPRDGALGKEIGFVPGDAVEKTLVKAKPIIDNLRSVLKLTAPAKKPKFETEEQKNLAACRDCIDKRVDEALNSFFEFESIIYMGGRSISNSFIIYDEFQDMERYQTKALLTRIGNGSKIVIMGDPSQVTNPHLNRTSNGLSYAASKLAGKPEAAIITLEKDEIVRSPAALAIADYFG